MYKCLNNWTCVCVCSSVCVCVCVCARARACVPARVLYMNTQIISWLWQVPMARATTSWLAAAIVECVLLLYSRMCSLTI